jgi:hypothetical protein
MAYDMRRYRLEQVFVRPRGGRLELLLVLENPAGARHRETLQFPTLNELEAVRRAARHLAARGDVRSAPRLRLRVERRGELRDEPSLRREFTNELAAESDDA